MTQAPPRPVSAATPADTADTADTATAAGATAAPARPGPGRLVHVPALDGARALAVLLVVGYHFDVPGLSGGFLGVDLFFVLSGFLITTLLLSEHAGTGRISLVDFWLRRARRLLPALFVLLAVVAVASMWADPLQKTALRGDLIASVAYVTNWHFIAEGQSYFTETVGASPLRHLWSLAIEEQFYVLWPLVVAALLALVARRPLLGHRVVAAAWLAATAASVALVGWLYEPADPSRAYFGTDARAHELLVGAGLAVLLARLGRDELIDGSVPARTSWLGRAQVIAGWLGVAAVAAFALSLTDDGGAYYRGGSLLFSVAVAALLAGAVGPATPLTRALSWRPLVWVGSVSYGMYLWHWPMAVWLTAESTGLSGPVLFAARSLATLGATALSFYLVEQPIRRGRLRGVRLGPRLVFPVALGTAVAVAALSVVTTRGAATSAQLDAFDTTDWSLQSAPAAGPDAEGRPAADGSPVQTGTPAIAIVGDSVARSLWPGLAKTANERGWSAYRAAFGSCEIGDLFNVSLGGKPYDVSETCQREVPQKQAEMIDAYDPDVVLWYSGRDRSEVLIDGTKLRAGTPAWLEAKFADWDRTLDRLSAKGARVVLLLPVMPAQTPPECERTTYRPQGCGSAGYLSNKGLREAYLAWAQRHPDRLEVVDPEPVVCPGGPPCPEEVGGRPLRFDKIHYSPEAAEWVMPRILALSEAVRALAR